MSFIKAKVKELILITIIFIPIVLIYTFLITFGKLSSTGNTFKNTSFIIMLVLFLIFGIISGIFETKRGWFAGMSTGLIIILMVLIIKLITKNQFKINDIIKYAAYFISCILGGIIGININLKRKV